MDIIGTTLLAPDQDATATYYSPWFARGGNLVYFQCDVISTDGLGGFTIDVYTKNSEHSDKDPNVAGSIASQAITLTAGTRTQITAGANLDSTSNGLLELVRLKYEVTGGSNAGGYVHFRILNMTWLSN